MSAHQFDFVCSKCSKPFMHQEWIGARQPWSLHNAKLPDRDGMEQVAVFSFCAKCSATLPVNDPLHDAHPLYNWPPSTANEFHAIYVAVRKPGADWAFLPPTSA